MIFTQCAFIKCREIEGEEAEEDKKERQEAASKSIRQRRRSVVVKSQKSESDPRKNPENLDIAEVLL